MEESRSEQVRSSERPHRVRCIQVAGAQSARLSLRGNPTQIYHVTLSDISWSFSKKCVCVWGGGLILSFSL